MSRAIGIDVGGSYVKAGVVDLEMGRLTGQSSSLATPEPAELSAVIEIVVSVAKSAASINGEWSGPIGVALPCIVHHGRHAAGEGLYPDWDGSDALTLIEARLGHTVSLINDADAAGIAEMQFGHGVGERGLVVVLTLGTLIGSALFYEGALIPNTELGQLELGGHSVETRLGGRGKRSLDLSWRAWGAEFSRYLDGLRRWFSPDLIVLAGGMTESAPAFLPYLVSAVPLKISKYANAAGIVGAAIAAGGR